MELTQTEKRLLRYDFTAKEVHDLSLQLAAKTKELTSLEEEKKTVNSQYAARINESKSTANKLSNQVSDGYEYREIECEVLFNKPERGKKTYVRKDTDKVALVEPMGASDWTLFNQSDDLSNLSITG